MSTVGPKNTVTGTGTTYTIDTSSLVNTTYTGMASYATLNSNGAYLTSTSASSYNWTSPSTNFTAGSTGKTVMTIPYSGDEVVIEPDAALNVKGQVIINGENLQERLERIETLLNIPVRDVEMEREFPKLKWKGWKRTGKNILLVTPSKKPCKFYGIELDKWLDETTKTIKQYTDRPIILRNKPELRVQRTVDCTIYDQLDDDTFALVTYNSIAASEAIAYGIPAFTLAPNAASPMCLTDLSKIETPYYPDPDEVHRWCCYLSYGQFNIDELANGTAWRLLNEYS